MVAMGGHSQMLKPLSDVAGSCSTVTSRHQDTVNNWVSTKSNWPLDSIESRRSDDSPGSTVSPQSKLQDGLCKVSFL